MQKRHAAGPAFVEYLPACIVLVLCILAGAMSHWALVHQEGELSRNVNSPRMHPPPSPWARPGLLPQRLPHDAEVPQLGSTPSPAPSGHPSSAHPLHHLPACSSCMYHPLPTSGGHTNPSPKFHPPTLHCRTSLDPKLPPLLCRTSLDPKLLPLPCRTSGIRPQSTRTRSRGSWCASWATSTERHPSCPSAWTGGAMEIAQGSTATHRYKTLNSKP